MKRLIPLLLVVVVLGACRSPSGGVGAPLAPDYPVEVRLPRNAVHPLDHPEAIPARAADLAPYTDVMGVEIGGEARAYPIGMLSRHEIANDTLGGTPILVTFCPLCNSGVVVTRPDDGSGSALTFDFSGRVLDNALVMVDRESETFWSQSRLMAIEGERAGEKLELIPAYQGSWEGWVARYPETTIVPGDKSAAPAALVDLPGLDAGQGDSDDVLNDYVVGITSGGRASAYSVQALESEGVLNDEIEGLGPIALVALGAPGEVRGWMRQVDGRVLTFYWADDTLRDQESGTAWDPATGDALSGPLAGETLEPLHFQISHWLGWVDLYPNSRLWRESGLTGRVPG